MRTGAGRTPLLAVSLTVLAASCLSGAATSTTTWLQAPGESTVTSTEPPAETTTTAATNSTALPAGEDVEVWAGDLAGQMVEFQFVVDDTGSISGLIGNPAKERPDIPINGAIGDGAVTINNPPADLRVPALEADLADNAEATVSEFDGLNHLFQTAETGAVSEYGRIEETFSPAAIDLIAGWILEHS